MPASYLLTHKSSKYVNKDEETLFYVDFLYLTRQTRRT